MDRLPPMTHYTLGVLRRPVPAPRPPATDADALQEGHLAHLRHLRESGEVITTGPVEEGGELRGFLIFRTDSIAHARALMQTDPLVAGGYLVLDLYRWFSPAGLGITDRSVNVPDLTFETD
ncbi:MAG TPA: YciI family protein [Thermoplasmata archaeon]|nr:YciI family protein [Thermoplasmata archaeon]